MIADQWIITDDPLRISFGVRKIFVDLGAERSLLAAERGAEKIAVEVKSFVGVSLMNDLENAIGQYVVYRTYLHEVEPGRTLYLAVDAETYTEVFLDFAGTVLLDANQIRLIVVDTLNGVVTQWIR